MKSRANRIRKIANKMSVKNTETFCVRKPAVCHVTVYICISGGAGGYPPPQPVIPTQLDAPPPPPGAFGPQRAALPPPSEPPPPLPLPLPTGTSFPTDGLFADAGSRVKDWVASQQQLQQPAAAQPSAAAVAAAMDPDAVMRALEVERPRLTLGRLLQEGTFGRVYSGTLMDESAAEEHDVYIKTVAAGSSHTQSQGRKSNESEECHRKK